MCGKEKVAISTPKIVQFEDFEHFFMKASDEEKFLLFQQYMVKLKVNEQWCLKWYAWCINAD